MVLENFRRNLHAWLWQQLSENNTSPLFKNNPTHITADSGLDKILVNQSQNKIFMISCPDRRLTLNFAGRVTRSPVVGSLPICECLGTKWYLDGTGFSDSSKD